MGLTWFPPIYTKSSSLFTSTITPVCPPYIFSFNPPTSDYSVSAPPATGATAIWVNLILENSIRGSYLMKFRVKGAQSTQGGNIATMVPSIKSVCSSSAGHTQKMNVGKRSTRAGVHPSARWGKPVCPSRCCPFRDSLHQSSPYGVTHYRGSPLVNDKELLAEGIDRFYDVLVEEKLQRLVDRQIQQFIETLAPDYQYSSREFLYLLGLYLAKRAKHSDSFVIQAARHGIPVFAPGLCDSSIGYSFVMSRRGVHDSKKGRALESGKEAFRYIDQMKDTDETVQIAECSRKSGVIYLGGGVPKNFIQQTELLNLILGHQLPGHEYAVQITTDTPHFGGLSGCTFSEAQSWGKIAKNAKMTQCFCDLTIALPILAQALCEEISLARRRPKPQFDWSGKHLKVNYR